MPARGPGFLYLFIQEKNRLILFGYFGHLGKVFAVFVIFKRNTSRN